MAIMRASLQSAAQQCARLTRTAQARCMGSLTQSHAKSIAPLLPHLPKSSKWKRTDAVPLTKDNYLDLLYGDTPLIKESNFLSAEQCKPYEALMSRQLTPYKHNTGPLLTKYGVAQFEYQAQAADDFLKRTNEKSQYFEDAARYLDLHTDLAAQGLDAWMRVFQRIKSMFPEWDVEVATEDNGSKKYFSGIFRALNDATHIHCDFSPYDSLTEDWIINQVEAQVVFNLYLAPVKGGRTIVHDVQWDEDALKYRDPRSYGYHAGLVENAQKAYVVPEPGALCFFNSRNMHEVEHVEKEPMADLGLLYRPRLTLSSFMGLIPSSKTGGRPKLIFWS